MDNNYSNNNDNNQGGGQYSYGGVGNQNTSNPYGTAGSQGQGNSYSYGTTGSQGQSGSYPYGTAGGQGQSGFYSYGTTGGQGMQNPQYSYNNSQGYNNYGQYGAGNGSPVDENGNPLKNRYGMKLAFCILEIITIIFCNLLSFVLGIIACVYTSKANNSYRQGRYEEFKRDAKTSAVCLWVGLAGVIITIICWIIFGIVFFQVFKEEYEKYNNGYYNDYDYNYDFDYDFDHDYDYDYNYDYDYDNDHNYDYDYDFNNGYDDSYGGDNFWSNPQGDAPLVSEEDTIDTPAEIGNYYQFTLEGWTLILPMNTADFLFAGFTLESDFDVTSYMINAGEFISVSYYSGINGEYLGELSVYNPNTAALTASDCVIIAITINNSAAFGEGYYMPNLELANGLTFASTQQEVLDAYGMPNDVYNYDTSDSSAYYWQPESYESSGYWDELEIEFWDGMIEEVYIYYSGEY